ncbi:hypothetical protein [Cochleicola gelatinilyticus]|uniref:Uncharacterized protein n=1 Tax=Cochleicola gelatinilyticus TaxID=1763537 RepID=A0A167IKG0_9FLAO|nr:hypothetical protein [Cochleicola gelatinilyticus]OAB79746.1 hypothetical protein ULVI_03095 [Cochleicola gelatinilyticus]
MQKKELENLAIALKNNSLQLFRVMNCATEQFIDGYIFQKNLDEKYNGDISQYLNSLKSRGIKKVQLFPYIKNGSGIKNPSPVITVLLEGAAATPKPALQDPQTPSTGLMASMGLNAMDVFRGQTAIDEVKKKDTEIQELKAEIERQKSSKKKYRKICQDYEIEKKTQPGAAATMLNGLAENPSIAMDLINKVLAGRNGGLQAANPAQNQNTQHLSPVQKILIQSIETVPDEYCAKLMEVLKWYNNNETSKIEVVESLLSEPILKKVDHNG